MLSERLKELEAEGIVGRNVSADPPVRVAYHLTDKGRALQEPLRVLGAWASEWIPAPGGSAT
jgi:DNA-binding HxlR family transcriptional regulator